MAYVVLARKYRPQVLADVRGQEHIVQALTNAISDGRVAQSFLFVGSRGVGKTSTARILAKILNCLKRKENETEPCNDCDSCREIIIGNSLDVIEIDGASNRGIDEIRNLRENVKFKPSYGKYKVYIIDEVHMLTTEAFNALLKTLEEPPEHVKFIFATTESHRVLPTIISRCQRYDFKRIPTATIADTLTAVAAQEKIAIDRDAVFAIAKASEGSLRDAESILDQMVNFAEGRVTLAVTERMLGFTTEGTYAALIDAIQKREADRALVAVQQTVADGKDMRQFVKGLLEFLRDMLMAATTKQPEEVIDRLPESIAAIKKQTAFFSVEELLYMLTVLQNVYTHIRYSPFPQIQVEIGIVKMVNRVTMVALDAVLQRLDALQKGGGSAVPARPQQSEPIKISPDDIASGAARQPDAAAGRPQATIKKHMEAYLDKAGGALTPDNAPRAENSNGRGTISFKTVEERWPDILQAVKKRRMSIGVFLSESEPIDIEGEQVTLGFPAEFTFHKETLESKDNKQLVEEIVSSVLGKNIAIRYVVTQKESRESVVDEGASDSEHHAQIIESALTMFQGKTINKMT